MKFFTKCLTFIVVTISTFISNVNSQSPSMIYNLNRHGVRVYRDVISSRESGPQLLSSAYDRLYIKGQHLRQNYPNLLSSTYKEEEIHLNSSAWQRTISTAHGILAGLYPSLNNVTMQIPIFVNPYEFDYTLYNYDKCPNYDASWTSFQQTTEFQQKVLKYSNLTTYLNTLINPSTTIKLSNIYSTWDVYWVQRNRPEAGNLYPNIDDYTYSVLTEAANWVETMRYGSRISSNYLGSTFLAAVKYRMDMFITKNSMFGHKWISSSAHYPTQLNVLASMGYTGIVSQSIPDYNSLITFELYNKTGLSGFPSGWSIKIRYWDGVISNSIPIALGNCIEGQECEIDYSTFWGLYKVKNLQQWCADCGSNLWMCVGANPSVITNTTVTNTVTQTLTSNDPNSVQVAILVLVGFLALVTLFNVYQYFKNINIASTVACTSSNHKEIQMNEV